MTISALAADERVVDLTISEDELRARLMDGRTISVPLAWFPSLLRASEAQRNNWQIVGGGYGIHWPDIDEDLSVEGFLRGTPATHRAARLSAPTRQKEPTKEPFTIDGEEASDGYKIFDLLAEGEDAVEALASQLDVFNELTTNVGRKISKHAEALEKIGQGAGRDKVKLINNTNLQAVSDMNHYSKWVEELVPEYEKTIDKLNNSYINLYQRINPEEVEDWSPIRSDRQAINTLLPSVTETIQKARTYRDVVENLKGFSKQKHMNRAAERQVKALDSMITIFTHIESFCLRCLQIIDEKLAQTEIERESGGEE
jgi:hypothetical protein